MSRAARNPIVVPAGVEVNISGHEVKVKGVKGSLHFAANSAVAIVKNADVISFTPCEGVEIADAVAGTVRALIKNMITGVTKGFEKKLVLKGVGFKASLQGKALVLMLGFSHPIKYAIPAGITIEVPTQTDLVIKGVDKQLVGQVAAELRAFRPPEPYKGKGVRYENEVVVMKEGKKK
jgi:large subunit ribosomal protein L6